MKKMKRDIAMIEIVLIAQVATGNHEMRNVSRRKRRSPLRKRHRRSIRWCSFLRKGMVKKG
ncbi:hypothetical protein Gotur_022430 [Gossypium turneri]